MSNTVQQQIAMVDELTNTLQTFLQDYEANIRTYLTQVRVIGDNNNALQEPFQRYMSIQQNAHQQMKTLKQAIEEESLPNLRQWKAKLEALLNQ